MEAFGFDALLSQPALLRAVEEQGWKRPFEVQRQCAVAASTGRDVLCLAPRNSGKSSALALACVAMLRRRPSSSAHDGGDSTGGADGPEVVVLCPNRELTLKMKDLLVSLGSGLDGGAAPSLGVVCGGERWRYADRHLLRGCGGSSPTPPRLLVGTPGRVRALLRDGSLSFSALSLLAVDGCESLAGSRGLSSASALAAGAGAGALSMLHDTRAVVAEASRCDARLMLFGATPYATRSSARRLLQFGAAAHRATTLKELLFGSEGSASSSRPRAPAAVWREACPSASSSSSSWGSASTPSSAPPMKQPRAVAIAAAEEASPALSPAVMHQCLRLPPVAGGGRAGGKGEDGDEARRLRALAEVLDVADFDQAVVFVGSPSRAAAVQKLFSNLGLSHLAVHEAIDETSRAHNCARFRRFDCRVLVVTDVGLLVSDEALGWRVNAVIHYDTPEDAEEYMRCAARAGPAGRAGVAITLVGSAAEEAVLAEVARDFGVGFGEAPGLSP